MTDIKEEYLDTLDPFVTDDEIASSIFQAGQAVTWSLNSTNSFIDIHDGVSGNNLKSIFKKESIINKRVGYVIDQKYKSCGIGLMNTEISRRIDLINSKHEIRKNHL